MARVLGDRGARKAGIASFFGLVSSSCSFAALAASRSILVKGAHPVNLIAFLISSTNLVIELGIVLLVLLGWKFMVANFMLGILMTVYAYALTLIWFPRSLVESAKEHAEKAQSDEGMDTDRTMKGSFRDKLLSRKGWDRIARAFLIEWKMVWKEILFGFMVAGFISVFVPQSFWKAIFLIGDGGAQDAPGFLIVFENALVAPIVAFFTFIGSMGNVPLAAMLWSRDASFGGVIAFLGADLVAATVIWMHAKYYASIPQTKQHLAISGRSYRTVASGDHERYSAENASSGQLVVASSEYALRLFLWNPFGSVPQALGDSTAR